MNVATPLHFLTPEQLSFFNDNGYLHLKSVVSEKQLSSIQAPLQKWVNRTISKWISKGLIDRDFNEYPFETRLLKAWTAAKYPPCNPMLTPEVFGIEIFEFMRLPVFLDIARDLLSTENLKAVWGFTCRPKLPARPPEAASEAPVMEIDVPWHQDAQYSGSPVSNFIILWVPLVDVDENKSPLQMAAGRQHDGLYDTYKHSGYCSISSNEANKLTNLKTIEMKKGDLLFMNALVPHRALANKTNLIRWSIDIRYENTDITNGLNPVGGFICSNEDPSKIETSFEACVEKFHAQYKKVDLG